jgi:peroxiredoxin
MRPALEEHGVRIVTVCTDRPDRIRAGRGKHGLQATMIADPELAVTDRFGLRNQKIQSGPPGRPQPVPTSILADASGTIVWMDQSESYQRRSDADYVLGAVREHLAARPGHLV